MKFNVTTSRVKEQTSDFETEWNKISPQVMTFCRRAIDDSSDIEEVFQRVAIRAWRGYPTFNRDATFLTWVLTITYREIIRAMSHRQERFKVEASLESVVETTPDMLPSLPALEMVNTDYSWLAEVTTVAATSGALTQTEAATILTRLEHMEESWDVIGAILGISGTTCATIHCRAIPKLRMFLFMHRPDLLGGLRAISAAFTKALADKSNLLSEQEIDAFQQVIVNGQVKYHKAGWRLALRSACGKVIKWLSLP